MNIIKALLHNQSNYYQSNHQASFTPNILHQASQNARTSNARQYQIYNLFQLQIPIDFR